MASDHFRAHPRRATGGEVVVRREGRVEKARLHDIGMGGAGLTTPTRLVAGTHLEVVLEAPSRWDPLVLGARVAWSEGVRGGVAFEPKDAHEVNALFDLLGAQAFEA
ncbi:MAG: PilZ domain-containing protein [Myxococcales bacterium]|jgi:PilZ domain|nr:PilZ domain-containing protein [Myxococcales bacterium]MBL8717770.1 PilZ domain-containing protein [Myxococcales bacterium]